MRTGILLSCNRLFHTFNFLNKYIRKGFMVEMLRAPFYSWGFLANPNMVIFFYFFKFPEKNVLKGEKIP